MSFKDDYKKTFENIVPSDGFEERLVASAQQERPKRARATSNRKHYALRLSDNRRYAGRLATGVAAVLVIVLVVGILPLASALGEVPFSAYSESYASLFETVNKFSSDVDIYGYSRFGILFGARKTATMEGSVNDSAMPESSSATPDYSDTNIQVEGVQEADIVKTDGRYIYTVVDDRVIITRVTDGNLTATAELTVGYTATDNNSNDYVGVDDIYVYGDTLVVLKQRSQWFTYEKNFSWYSRWATQTVLVDIYDLTDRSAPRLVNTIGVDGGLLNSRMIGKYLYLVSDFYPSNELSKDNLYSYVPSYYTDGNRTVLEAGDVSIAPNAQNKRYVVVAGIDVSGDTELVSTAGYLGGGNEIYASLNNLYVFGTRYIRERDGDFSRNSDVTDIARFELKDGAVEFKASGSVQGSMINQFAADENSDYLRIATTCSLSSVKYSQYTQDGETYESVQYLGEEKHSLISVLDTDLNIVGKTAYFGHNESIKSVRFSGEIAYVVTFRNTDPLFAIDLSDPTEPEILSALKIPGFSQYMQSYGDGLLFGFGVEADEYQGGILGLKLSMFDVSDPTDVTQLAKLVDDRTSYSSASYNHKAILVDAQKGIIGFATYLGYHIYTYDKDNKQFTSVADLTLDVENEDYWYRYYEVRGLYIGNYFYTFNLKQLASFDMTNGYALHSVLQL